MARRPNPYPSQWAAIEDADRHVLVVAGAGTGKTFTVVQRILYALGIPVNGERRSNPVTLDEVAAITFTNQAAKELKEALRQALRAADRRAEAYRVDQARIGTIHGFCAELLRENALRRGVAPASKVLEEGEALAGATQAARDALVEALEDGSIEGLAELLAMWETSRVDRWVVELMRRPDLIRASSSEPGALDARERAVVALARLALQLHETRLEKAGAVDFDRLILWTRDLLRDDAAARRRLQRRLRLLVIDEFQDVDPAQKEIAYLIGEPASGRAETPRLMLVGDPKQSIYRFRRADVTVWNDVERAFTHDPHCAVHALVENFRSLPAILGFVDATAGRLLDEPVSAAGAVDEAGEGGDEAASDAADAPAANGDEPAEPETDGHSPFEVRFRPVRATRTSPDGSPVVELFVTPADATGRAHRAETVRKAEAVAIARRACELHDAGFAWRDMALLLSAWGPEPIFSAALRSAGVPVYVYRDVGFFDQREVVDLLLALQTVRDPSDDAALFGFLRGPFVGLRDDSLLAIARSSYPPFWRGLREIVLPRADEDERLQRAIDLIWRYVQLRDRMPAAALLDAMARESGFVAHLTLLGDDGLQAIANVRRFLALAREMKATSAGDLLRAIRESRERDDRVAQARLYGASEDVMLVTSIHVSKGLEWPIVFWADLGAWPAPTNQELLIGRDTIRLGTPEQAKNESPAWQALRKHLGNEAAAERKRLWYVAATRARDRLVVSGIAQNLKHKTSLAWNLLRLFPSLHDPTVQSLAYAGSDGATYRAIVRVAAALDADPATSPGAHPARNAVASAGAGAAEAGDELPEAGETPPDPDNLALPREPVASPAGLLRHSATEFLAHARCPRRHWFKYTLGIREPESGATKEQLITAVARGQIVHDVLERTEAEAELDALLEDAIGRWDENAPPAETGRGRLYREHLSDEVSRVLEHPDYAALVARPGSRRELAFLHVRSDGSAGQGFIDLAAPTESGDGIELLDVKTTQCDAGVAQRKAEQYAPQRDVYTVAAGAIAELPVTRFAFQFSRARVQIAETLDAAGSDAARARIDQRIRAIESGASPFTTYAEECGFCGYRRVGLCPGAWTAGRDPETVLRRLRADRFRRSFRLRSGELMYVQEKGIATVLDHAREFIATRLAPAAPANDGHQTPFRGHPAFIAQHATATCCRGCLEKRHGIAHGRELSAAEQDWIIRVIERWIASQIEPADAKR